MDILSATAVSTFLRNALLGPGKHVKPMRFPSQPYSRHRHTPRKKLNGMGTSTVNLSTNAERQNIGTFLRKHQLLTRDEAIQFGSTFVSWSMSFGINAKNTRRTELSFS